MTVYLTPDTQQTLPGRSRRYRLWDIEHCDWNQFASTDTSLVTASRWGVSYSQTNGEGPWTLKVYDVSGLPEEGIEYHALNGTTYNDRREAQRIAFNHGLLAFMEYVDPPTVY